MNGAGLLDQVQHDGAGHEPYQGADPVGAAGENPQGKQSGQPTAKEPQDLDVSVPQLNIVQPGDEDP